MPATVSLEDLEHALYWTSFAQEYGNAAYVSRSTGRCFPIGPDGPVDPDCPDDIDDATEYLEVPERNELGLGKPLVFAFIDEAAPGLRDEVHRLFRQRGAYARLKAVLQRKHLLDAWHEYERRATLQALEEWANENGFVVKHDGAA